MTHKLKIQQQYLQAIVDGLKTFEIRFNDRKYHVGDILDFDLIKVKVIYIHSGLGLQDGYVCMSIERYW